MGFRFACITGQFLLKPCIAFTERARGVPGIACSRPGPMAGDMRPSPCEPLREQTARRFAVRRATGRGGAATRTRGGDWVAHRRVKAAAHAAATAPAAGDAAASDRSRGRASRRAGVPIGPAPPSAQGGWAHENGPCPASGRMRRAAWCDGGAVAPQPRTPRTWAAVGRNGGAHFSSFAIQFHSASSVFLVVFLSTIIGFRWKLHSPISETCFCQMLTVES